MLCSPYLDVLLLPDLVWAWPLGAQEHGVSCQQRLMGTVQTANGQTTLTLCSTWTRARNRMITHTNMWNTGILELPILLFCKFAGCQCQWGAYLRKLQTQDTACTSMPRVSGCAMVRTNLSVDKATDWHTATTFLWPHAACEPINMLQCGG